MVNGCVPSTFHNSLYQFRDKSPNANIYVRNYLTSVDKSIQGEYINKQAILEKMNFVDASKRPELRSGDQLKEKRNRLRYQAINATQRVQESINKQHPIELENFDMLKCKIKPNFKETNKKLWKTSAGFKVKQAKNVWKIQQYRDA